MNARHLRNVCLVLAVFSHAAISSGSAQVGTAFTYQGQLKEGGAPVDDTADFKFTLWNAENDGSLVSPPDLSPITTVDVTNGLFTVVLDFGPNVFTGEARWLQAEVCVAVSCAYPDDFTVLSPRAKLTAVPYALQTPGIFVDASGNVGIGTVNPTARLTIDGTPDVDGIMFPDGTLQKTAADGVVENHAQQHEVNGGDEIKLEKITGYDDFTVANVRFFGATPDDNSDDDTDAFVDAFKTGKHVFVPEGTYHVKNTITVDRNSNPPVSVLRKGQMISTS